MRFSFYSTGLFFFFRFAESFTYLPIIAVCKSLCARSCIFTACFFSIKCNIRPIKPMLNKLKTKNPSLYPKSICSKDYMDLALKMFVKQRLFTKKNYLLPVYLICVFWPLFFLTQKAIFALMKLFWIVSDLVKHKWTIETNCMCTDICSVCRQINILSCTCMLNTLQYFAEYV